MNEIMALVVGWTLVGGFVFTVAITLLSLPGWVRFADKGQQKKLFIAIVLELVVGVGTWGLGGAKFDADEVSQAIKTEGANEVVVGILDDLMAPRSGPAPQVTKEQIEKVVNRLKVGGSDQLRAVKADLQTRIRRLPSGPLHSDAIRTLRPVLAPIRRAGGR